MRIANNWQDYEIIATGNGEKLEKIGGVCLLRPDPQVIWQPQFELSRYKDLHARYNRESGGGAWQYFKKIPDEWDIKYGELKFTVKPMGFKHVGVFPEQAVNWDIMTTLIKQQKRQINILNLFAYTGGASLVCAKAGAKVTHVDAARGMVERAKTNAIKTSVKDSIRFIVDDCIKFVTREIKRGIKYDAVIMDPPSYGRGPSGEVWKIEDGLYSLCVLTARILSDNPLFFLINSYTTGLQGAVLDNILALTIKGGKHSGYEVCLPTNEGIVLPCGCSGLWTDKEYGL